MNTGHRKLFHLREECLQLLSESLKFECQPAFNSIHIPSTLHIRRRAHSGNETVAHTTRGSNGGDGTRLANIANKQKHPSQYPDHVCRAEPPTGQADKEGEREQARPRICQVLSGVSSKRGKEFKRPANDRHSDQEGKGSTQ